MSNISAFFSAEVDRIFINRYFKIKDVFVSRTDYYDSGYNGAFCVQEPYA